MIREVDEVRDGEKFDRVMEPSDWRYAAAIVGLSRFFDKMGSVGKKMCVCEGRKFYYRYADIAINEENDAKYYSFAEIYFKDRMHHVELANCLRKDSWTELDVKAVNIKLSANTIMKRVFKEEKMHIASSAQDKQRMLDKIERHRIELIKETFRNSKSGYIKFANENKMRTEPGEICRLLGFYVDTNRKTKSLGFGFDKDSRTYHDEIEFDFIPFAFTTSNLSIFINNNATVPLLTATNDRMQGKQEDLDKSQKSWNSIFYSHAVGAIFQNYDVEVIKKAVDIDYYESTIVRRSALKTFQKLLGKRKAKQGEEEQTGKEKALDSILHRYVRISEDCYISIMDRVTDSVLNNIMLDELIERIMKASEKEGLNESFLLSWLIRINMILYTYKLQQEETMDREKYLKMAQVGALETVKWLKTHSGEKKIQTYRQRLTNILIAKDYDRFIETMLQLSSYTEISYGFLHSLIADFEENKNVAYQFVNSLMDFEAHKKTKEQGMAEGGK